MFYTINENFVDNFFRDISTTKPTNRLNSQFEATVLEDGKQKVGGSLVFTPIEGLTTKIYADSQPSIDSDAITTLSLFAGYKASNWRFGAEYNKLNN